MLHEVSVHITSHTEASVQRCYTQISTLKDHFRPSGAFQEAQAPRGTVARAMRMRKRRVGDGDGDEDGRRRERGMARLRWKEYKPCGIGLTSHSLPSHLQGV